MPVVDRVESSSDRRAFASAASMGQVSLISVLAGTLVAYAAFAVLLAVVAAILAAVGVDTTGLTSNDWRQAGIGGGIVAALVLLVSYFFGGYVAGRMARRAGALNGGLVFLLAVLIAIVVGVLVGAQTNTEALADNLRTLGVPTSGSEYGDIATVAGIAAIVAMLLGAVLGGKAGERWHGKLATRALSAAPGEPAYRRERDDDRREPDDDRRERDDDRRGRDDDRRDGDDDRRDGDDDGDRDGGEQGLPSRPWATGEQSWGDDRRDEPETAGTPPPSDEHGDSGTPGGTAGRAPRRRERPLRSPSPRNR
ncbi:MAG: YrzE family protein [Actinobacteria bacterium]|nr:YrzE family protein [Actinomycetota bacterium]